MGCFRGVRAIRYHTFLNLNIHVKSIMADSKNKFYEIKLKKITKSFIKPTLYPIPWVNCKA